MKIAEHVMTQAQCPECGTKGHQIEGITVKALLCPDALARLEQAEYRFCASPACPVVYFSDATDSVYHTRDMKVRVGLKETADPIPLCYCFGHTRASVTQEIQQTGRSTAVATITGHIQAGRCGCDVNNPSGSCCLGTVSKAIKELSK